MALLRPFGWSSMLEKIFSRSQVINKICFCGSILCEQYYLIIQGGPGNTTHPYSLSQVAEILLIMTQIGHFATRFLTKSKEMGTIWTSRFEDKSLNFIARYF